MNTSFQSSSHTLKTYKILQIRRKHRERVQQRLTEQRNSSSQQDHNASANENPADDNDVDDVIHVNHADWPIGNEDGDGDSLRLNGLDESDDEEGNGAFSLDVVDHLIEMDGHIIGMCLSRDQRFVCKH